MSAEEIGRRFGIAREDKSEEDLSGVIEILAVSKAPIIMAGQGVAFSHTGAALVAAAEHLGAPVTVTARSKGCIPEDHPLFAGTFGVYTDAPIYSLIREADLILAVGLDGVEFFKPWKIELPVVSVALAGANDPSYCPGTAVDGDLSYLLGAIRKGAGRTSGWTLERIEKCRRDVAAMMVPNIAEAGGRVAPQTVLEEMRRLFPRNGILTVDVGAHKLIAMAQWPAYEPETFLTTSGLASMGYAIPGAIAAKLARYDRQVVAFTGDGGFLMCMGELETLARLKLSVTIVVMNDAALSSIKVKQVKRNLPPVGVDFGEPDYAGIARDFGLLGMKASSREEFAKVFRLAMESGRGAVIEVATSGDEYLRYQ
ncbi:MAG: thiamine pyrophosphate-dependent enzyme [Deltaproteobacteria bacterium]|nr:thiamine pyrophosphate-dependent enzyme [Deltaproteobacteria bacterium]